MSSRALTFGIIAILAAGTTVLAALSAGCTEKKGGFATGGGGGDDDDTEDLGVVGCPEDEAFALELVEEGADTCTFQISIALDGDCQVTVMELHGAGAAPADGSLDVKLRSETEDDMSPGASFHEEYDWTTPLPWNGLATGLNGLLTVVVTRGEVESCAALGTLYLRVQATSIGDE